MVVTIIIIIKTGLQLLDVALQSFESPQGIIGTCRNETRDRVGGGGVERTTCVLVRGLMVLGEKDQPFPRPFRFRDPVFEEELTGARLIPGLKGGILQVPEGSLSVTIVLAKWLGSRLRGSGDIPLSYSITFEDRPCALPVPQLFHIPFGVS